MWNPIEQPYRVRWVANGGPYGWRDRVATFSTLAEAEAALAAPAKDRGLISVEIDRAVNAETWSRNGRWVPVQARKARRKQAA